MTKPMGKLLARAGHFLRRMVKKLAWNFNHFVRDPRHKQGRRWPFAVLRQTLLFGFLTNRRSLRNVETLSALTGAQRVPVRFMISWGSLQKQRRRLCAANCTPR